MDSFLIQSHYTMFVVAGTYLVFVLKLGPNLMKDRKPFQLNAFLSFYNISQIIMNAYMFIKVANLMPYIDIKSKPDLPPSLQTASVSLHHQFNLLKTYDLIDTIVFVLRKKQNQITFLHVYHHTFVFLWCVMAAKYFPLGTGFPVSVPSVFCFCNTFVHAFMYAYYFLTSRRTLSPATILRFKKFVTTIQLIQHYMILTVAVINLVNPNIYITMLMVIVVLNMLLLIYLFTTFYINAYVKTKKTCDGRGDERNGLKVE